MNSWWQWVAWLSGRAAEITTIVGIIVAVVTYRKSVHDTSKANQTQLMRNSMDVIGMFNDTFLPQLETYQRKFEAEYQVLLNSFVQTGTSQIDDFPDHPIPDSMKDMLIVQTQGRAGIHVLFSELEQLCTYIRCDLMLDDIVYPVIHHEFLEFIGKSQMSLSLETTDETPLIGIHFTVEKWKNKSKATNI